MPNDEYMIAIATACSQTVSVSNGFSTGYLYESAKDVLKDMGINVLKYVKDIMDVGNILFLSDEDFKKAKQGHASETITADEVREMYADWRRKNGSNQN